MKQLKTFIKAFAFIVIIVPVLVVAVVTMLFFSVLSFRSESAQQDVTAYKKLSDAKLSDGKKYLTEKKDDLKKYASVMPQSGTTVITVAWEGFQEIRENRLG